MIFRKDILNGSVKLITEWSDKVIYIKKEIGFDSSGNKTYEHHLNGPIPEYYHDFEYNSYGLKTKESFGNTEMYSSGSFFTIEYCYNYDMVLKTNGYGEGGILEMDRDDLLNEIEIETFFFGEAKYNYGSNGNLQDIIVNGVNNSHTHCTYSYGLDNELLAVTIANNTNIKSKNDSLSASLSDHLNVKILIHYTYPQKNTICVHRIQEGKCKSKITINVSDDNVLRWVLKENDMGSSFEEYDDNGNLVKRDSLNFKYEFDSHGNWIKKTIYSDVDSKCIETLKRNIKYYSDYFINTVNDIVDSETLQ